MTALDDRLRALGDVLDLDDEGLVDDVLARLDRDDVPTADRLNVLRIAVAVVVVLVVAVLSVPSSRRAVADWFGLDGAEIERRPGATAPAMPDPLDRGAVGTVVDVDGTAVLLSEFSGTLEHPAIGKTLTDDTRIRRVTVGGEPGLWIDGAPHEVAFLDERGDVVFRGVAGNTLLWQDGPVIRRLEGFEDVDAAIEAAETLGH